MVEQEDEELVVQRACRRRATAPALRLQQRRLVLLTHVAEDGRGLGEAQLAVDVVGHVRQAEAVRL